MKREDQHSERHHDNKLIIGILLFIILIELSLGHFDPTYWTGLGNLLTTIIVWMLRLAFYVAIMIVMFYVGRAIGEKIKKNK